MCSAAKSLFSSNSTKRPNLLKIQSEELRRMEEFKHQSQLADVEDPARGRTKRNRFFTLSLDLLAIASFDDCFIQLNPVWESTLGLPLTNFAPSRCSNSSIPRTVLPLPSSCTQVKMGSSAPKYFENRYPLQGWFFPLLGWTAAPFPSEQLVYIFARDITARKNSETEIRGLKPGTRAPYRRPDGNQPGIGSFWLFHFA